MTAPLRHEPAKTYNRYFRPGTRRCAFFIHGLGGNNTAQYWGRLIDLLPYDDDLVSSDFCFWGYKSSRYGAWPKLTQLSTSERLATIPDLAMTLRSDVERIVKEHNYSSILLFGHSLGGLLSLECCSQMRRSTQRDVVKSVCLNATPLKPNLLARVATSLFQDFNPQTQYLADLGQIETTLKTVATLRKRCDVTYIYCANDWLLQSYEKFGFTKTEGIQAPHTWMQSVKNRDDTNYKIISAYLKNALFMSA